MEIKSKCHLMCTVRRTRLSLLQVQAKGWLLACHMPGNNGGGLYKVCWSINKFKTRMQSSGNKFNQFMLSFSVKYDVIGFLCSKYRLKMEEKTWEWFLTKLQQFWEEL